MDDPLNEPTSELLRWHERPCGWCGGWGFLIDVDEDSAPYDVRDLHGRRALPGEYRVTVRRRAHLGDRFTDGQMIGCGACDETGCVAHPTTECTPACAAPLAQPPAPAPAEQAIICAGCGLYVVTLDDDMTYCEECRTVEGAARPVPAALPVPWA